MYIIEYAKKHWAIFTFITLLSAGGALLTTGMIDHINTSATQWTADDAAMILAKGAGLAIALIIMSIATKMILAWVGGELVHNIRRDITHSFLNINYENMLNKQHTVSAALIEDVQRIIPMIFLLPDAIYNVLLLVLLSAYLISLSPALFGVLGIAIAVLVVVGVLVQRSSLSLTNLLREEEDKLFAYFRAISEGKKELHLHPKRKSHFIDENLEPSLLSVKELTVKYGSIWGVFESVSAAFLLVAVFTLVYVGNAVLQLPSGIIASFVLGSMFIIKPTNFLAHIGAAINSGLSSLSHLEKIGLNLNESLKARDKTDEQEQTPPNWQQLALCDVEYRYPGAEEERVKLGAYNLEINKGDVVFFTGGNGSGKTTLLLLLTGLLKPESGQVKLDGKAIDYDVLAYRNLFGGVFCDYFLFTDVLNAEGKRASEQDIEEAIKLLQLGNFIEVENGVIQNANLSTGQRKRLALMQAYISNNDIFFFDEWAAEQDPVFRDTFYSQIIPELKNKGKTVLVISHDDRYFNVADKIVKLEYGQIESVIVNNHVEVRESAAAEIEQV